ncbi:peptidase inhibitor family I36 protein [Streptomyces sp. NPDC055210]
MSKSRASALLFATAVAVGATAVVAPPANAAYNCANNQVCLYKESDFRGSVYILPQVTLSNGAKIFCARDLSQSRYSDGSSVDNTVSSVVNNSDSVLFLREFKNEGGKLTSIRGGYRVWNLDSVQTIDPTNSKMTYESFNDRASSAC